LFTRICLEAEEGPNHILYFLFGELTTSTLPTFRFSGITKKLWQTYESTFDKMSEFELIDMKRFEK